MKALKYLAICAAALTFAACNVEEPVAPNTDANLVTVHFGAEVVAPVSTKATLTPGEEKFAADWTVGDKISIQYLNDGGATGIVDAVWDGTSFVAELPEYTGEWVYGAFYPSVGTYDCTNVSQKGADYNSLCDMMGSNEIVVIGEAGKDADGNPLVFQMQRETAIVYFHFTSNLDEAVTSAKLSVTGASLAFSDVSIEVDETGFLCISYEGDEPTINLSIEDQNAKDFTLWFNVGTVPDDEEAYPYTYTYDDLALTVRTETKEMTLTRENTVTYEAGKLYKVEMAIDDEKWGEPTVEDVTVSTTINDIVEENGYTVSSGSTIKDMITCIQLDENLAMSTDGKPNSGTFWGTDPIDWRLYQTTGANLRFEVAEGYLIKSVKVTYNSSNGGSLFDDGVSLASGVVDEEINLPEIVYTIGSTTAGKTNGQVKVTAVEVVYCEGEYEKIPVEGVDLGIEAFTLKVGEAETLEPDITPENATNKKVTWSSSNEAVATVDGGVVTAVGAGVAEITVTTVDGGFTSSCTVAVSGVPVYSSLEALVAAGEPTTEGYAVTVTLDEVVINSFYTTSSGYKNGVFVSAGSKEIEIYCKDVPSNWVAGGTLSGTLEECIWKKYNSTWELCPETWDDLKYVAPETIVPVGESAVFKFNDAASLEAFGIVLPAASAGTSLDPETDYSVDDFILNVTHGSTADTRIWNSSGKYDLRIYKGGGTLTLTAPEGKTMTSIVLAGSAVGVFTASAGTFSAGTWTAPEGGAETVTFTATGTGKINTVEVFYE